MLQHRIPTTTEQPICQAARRIPPFRRDEVDRSLQNMLDHDVIQPLASPWASPIALVQRRMDQLDSVWITTSLIQSHEKMLTHFLVLILMTL